MEKSKDIQSYCKKCGNEINHEILYSFNDKGSEPDHTSWEDDYQIIKCYGCNRISFRIKKWFSENQDAINDGTRVETFPESDKYKKKLKEFENMQTTENNEQEKDFLGNPIPKYVYHYTNYEALKGILEKNELWLSNRKFMNDINDEKYVQDLVKKELEPSYQKCINFEGSIMEDAFLVRNDKYQYIFSTSTENDSIHQWSCYAKQNGYCIKFETDKLINFFKDWDIEKMEKIMKEVGQHSLEDESLQFGNVIYEPDEAEVVLKEVMEERKESISKSMDSAVPNRATDDIFRYTYIKFKTIYSLIKQKGHSCENEFRFLIRTKYISPDFRSSNGLDVSYIKFARTDNKTQKNILLPIKSISIDPTSHNKVAENKLKELLEKIDLDIPIGRSELNMR